MSLSKQLIKELRAVKEAILKEPNKFDMDYLFENKESGKKWGGMDVWLKKLPIKEFKTDCGTTACIDGTHRALFPKSTIANQLRDDDTYDRLCYHEEWPEPYCSRYHRAKTHITRAKVAAERIEHFITTGGEE